MKRFTQWPPRGIREIEKDLTSLAERTLTKAGRADASSEDDMWLTRFLVVRTCGYLERVITDCTTDFIQQKTGGPVTTFALSSLPHSINPSPIKISSLLKRLSPALEEEFQCWLKEGTGRRKEDLDALVERRNQIAHGRNDNLGPRRAREILETVLETAEWVISRLSPHVSQPWANSSATTN